MNTLPDTASLSVDLPTPARALAVGAHPDDIELGAGGTLAKWSAAGSRIHFLILTDGSKGSWDPDADSASLVAARQEEQREAALRLGCTDVAFLGRTDGELRNGVREQWEVCRWIRSALPDVVLGHDPWRRYRLHPDHRHAGFILTDAIVAARDPLFFTDQDMAPHRPAALLLWEADAPNHVENVSDYVDAKVDALLAYRSQFETTFGFPVAGDGPPAGSGDPAGAASRSRLDRQVRQQLAEHGRLAGVPLGESFHLIDDL